MSSTVQTSTSVAGAWSSCKRTEVSSRSATRVCRRTMARVAESLKRLSPPYMALNAERMPSASFARFASRNLFSVGQMRPNPSLRHRGTR
jgi:hypothetical protein